MRQRARPRQREPRGRLLVHAAGPPIHTSGSCWAGLWSGCVSHLLEPWVSAADTTPMKQDVATTARATPHSPKSDLSMNVKPSRTPVLDPPTFTAESAPPLSIGEQIQHARNLASRKPGATVICLRNHGPVAGLVIGDIVDPEAPITGAQATLLCAARFRAAGRVIERRRGPCGHPSRVCSVLSLTLLMFTSDCRFIKRCLRLPFARSTLAARGLSHSQIYFVNYTGVAWSVNASVILWNRELEA